MVIVVVLKVRDVQHLELCFGSAWREKKSQRAYIYSRLQCAYVHLLISLRYHLCLLQKPETKMFAWNVNLKIVLILLLIQYIIRHNMTRRRLSTDIIVRNPATVLSGLRNIGPNGVTRNTTDRKMLFLTLDLNIALQNGFYIPVLTDTKQFERCFSYSTRPCIIA